MNYLFPFSDYWWLYLVFVAFILLIVLLDLGLFHRKAHAVSLKEATIWSLIWIALALCFNFVLYEYTLLKFSAAPDLIAWTGKTAEQIAHQVGLEFLTGYIVEKSLSIDNIFVFVVIFNYFAIPNMYQHRILFYGILGALIFRGIFITLGSVLMQYHWIIIIFGIFLIITGVKLCFSPDKDENLDHNFTLRMLKKILPITNTIQDGRFFLRENGAIYATPIFVALAMVEFSDVIFAVDSVPAIFAITKEPFIVFSSNMMAILGLRSLYFLLAGSVDLFHLLKYGLGIVLIFVGLKMVWLNELFGGKFPIVYSLIFIGSTIAITMILSVMFPKKNGKTNV
jgi:tellurite resistance protein TerC